MTEALVYATTVTNTHLERDFNMRRLLFAAARGARIQEADLTQTQWVSSHAAHLNPDIDWQRIHPDDEHLQYGTISSALRDRVLNDAPFRKDYRLAIAYVRERFPEWGLMALENCPTIDLETTQLIMAEVLADEGL